MRDSLGTPRTAMAHSRSLLYAACLTAIACAPQRADYTITPSDWSSSASTQPPCVTSAPEGEVNTWQLPDSIAQLALPAVFLPNPSGRSDIRDWVAADSASVEVWVTPEPAATLMAKSKRQPALEPFCRITIGGHFAPVVPFHVVSDSVPSRIWYAAMVSTVPYKGVALNITIQSPSPAERDLLLGFVAGIRFRILSN
jgi:hypothetical protein